MADDGPLLTDALQAIASTGVRLIYSTETVPPGLRARHPAQGATTVERLHSLLAPLELEARPIPAGGYAIIHAWHRAAAALTFTVSIDGKSPAEAVAGAVVYLPEARRRARTDRFGHAKFADLPPATYSVEVRAEGFRTMRRAIRVDALAGDAAIDISLVPEPTSLEQVVVETSRYDATATVGAQITREALETNPVTSNDAVRSLQVLPGAAVAGYTARTHVRGSRDDEMLFRFDGVTLTDPYHLNDLQSLFSTIDPASVESVSPWTGIAPIDFGGRIGAVVDIEPRRVTSPTLDAQVSQRDASLLLGTSFAEGRGSIFSAVRLGNALAPVGWIDQEVGPPSFDDLVVRGTWTFGPRTRLAAGVFAVDDRREAFAFGRTEDVRVSGQDLYAWIRLMHEILPGVRSETLLSSEDARDHVSGQAAQAGIENGVLSKQDDHSSYTLREELTIAPTPRWAVHLGAEGTETFVESQLASVTSFAAPFVPALQANAAVTQIVNTDMRVITSALYGGVRWQATDWTVADFGLRRDSRQFRSFAGDSQWNVRTNLRQRLSDSTTLRLGWGQVSQADVVDVTSEAVGSARPAPARRLTQSSLILEQALGNGLSFRAEAYAKRERAPVDAYENIFSQFALVPELEVDYELVRAQGARMRGLEVSIERDQSRPLSGWLSYTWSRAEDLIAGQWTPRSWDQPHAIQFGMRWQHDAWRAAGVLSWHSGWPYTPLLTSSTQWINPNLVTFALGPRNSARLENVVSLDLRLSWERLLWDGVLETYLALYDATDSQAVCCRNYTVVGEPDGSSRLVASQGNWLTFTPILGIRWRH